ncbi:MAG: hypothetical protein OHK0050_43710 [Roseiflexaceae bacterium]
MSSPVSLATSQEIGILIFWPFYTLDAPIATVEERREHIEGFIVGVFRLPDLIANALSVSELSDIDGCFYHQTGSQQPTLFYIHSGSSENIQAMQPEIDPRQLQRNLFSTMTIDLAGQSWQLIFKPGPNFEQSRRTWVPWIALISGMIFSIWITRTIVQRQNDAEMIQRSEARFRSMIEKSDNVITLLNDQGRVMYSSPNYLRNLGYEPHSRIGSDALDFIHPEDLPDVARLLITVLSQPGATRTH